METTTRRTTKDPKVLEAITHNLTADGTLQASYARLAQLANVSPATVIRAVTRLEATGQLTVTRATGPQLGDLPNTYTLP